jgi:hypothetical protein
VCKNVQKVYAKGTRDSQAVTHPSTNRAQCCLTSVIGREPVRSTWYGPWQRSPSFILYLFLSSSSLHTEIDKVIIYPIIPISVSLHHRDRSNGWMMDCSWWMMNLPQSEIPQNKISDVNRLPYGHSKIIKLEKLGTSLNSGSSTEQAPTTDSYLCYAYTHFL